MTTASGVGPHATYQVNIQSGGNYQFWIAGWGPDVNADSVYGGVNGNPVGTVIGFPSGGSDPAWRKLSGPISLLAGINTIDLWAKEDGLHIYKILLTQDPNFIPPPDGMTQSACSVIVPPHIPPNTQQCFSPIVRGDFEGTFFEVSDTWQSKDLAVVYSVTSFEGNRGAAFPGIAGRSPAIYQTITMPTWILDSTSAVLTLDKAVSHKNFNSPNPNDVLYFTLRRESDGFQLIDPVPIARGDDQPNLDPILNPPESWTFYSQDIFAGLDPLSVLEPGDRVQAVIFAPDPISGAAITMKVGDPTTIADLYAWIQPSSLLSNSPVFDVPVSPALLGQTANYVATAVSNDGWTSDTLSAFDPVDDRPASASRTSSNEIEAEQNHSTLDQSSMEQLANGRIDDLLGIPSASLLPPPQIYLGTVADDFDPGGDYTGNDGSQNWETIWQEVNDDGSTGGGNIQVLSTLEMFDTNALRIGARDNLPSNAGLWREADLTFATSATLSFDYRRDSVVGYNASSPVVLEVSSDGGSSWTQLFSWENGIDSSIQSPDFDITAYASADTVIRFRETASAWVDGYLYLDNIQIAYTINNQPPVVTNPGTRTDNEGDAVSLTIDATDPEGFPLSFSAANLPTGLAIGASTGVISGTISSGAAGSYEVTTQVSDGSNIEAITFTWIVSNGGTPVTKWPDSVLPL